MTKKIKLRLIDGAIILCIMTAAGSGFLFVRRGQAKSQNEELLQSLSDVVEQYSGGGNNTDSFSLMNGLSGQDPSGSGGAKDASGQDAGAGAADDDLGTAADPMTPEEIAAATAKRASRIPGYEILRAKNPDTAGWVTVPGTPIDYPVMQSVDRPNYYLKHNFDKSKSSYGVPYAAEHCDLTGNCPNVVIYGHHMKNGTMFAGLMKYTDQSFWQAHPYLWFDTLDEPGLYEIIGAVRASASDREEEIFHLAYADTEEEYQAFIEELKKRSMYNTGLDAEYGDPLVTLITCEYTRDEGRLLVTARKVED